MEEITMTGSIIILLIIVIFFILFMICAAGIVIAAAFIFKITEKIIKIIGNFFDNL